MTKYRIEFECEPSFLEDQLSLLVVGGFSDFLKEVDFVAEQESAIAVCKSVCNSISELIQDDLICLLDSQFGEVEYVEEVKTMACAIVVDRVREKLKNIKFAFAFGATPARVAKNNN
jgi:hypothetical protein